MNKFFFIFLAVISNLSFLPCVHGKEFAERPNDSAFILVRAKNDIGQLTSARILSPAPLEDGKNTVVSSGETVSVKGEFFTLVDMWNVSVSGKTEVLWNFLYYGDMNMSAKVSVAPEDKFIVAFGCLLEGSSSSTSGICVKTFRSENGIPKSDIALLFENGSRVLSTRQNYPAHYPKDFGSDLEPDSYPEQKAWGVYNPKLAESEQGTFLAFNAECKGDLENVLDDDIGKCLVLMPIYDGEIFSPGIPTEVISERTRWGGIYSGFGETPHNWNFGEMAKSQFLVVLLPHWVMKVGVREAFCAFCRTNFKWFYPVETETLR
mgnify:CR=1 FL=1